jgi:MFS family permease
VRRHGRVTDAAALPGAVPAYQQVLGNVEFRALWLAPLSSAFGDQVTRVALAAVVLARTGEMSLSAASVAVTFLPWLLGAPLLDLLADRCPRRTVMVWCDAARAGLVALMAAPLPVPLLLVLASVASLLGSPFEAARCATIP